MELWPRVAVMDLQIVRLGLPGVICETLAAFGEGRSRGQGSGKEVREKGSRKKAKGAAGAHTK